jgi:succinyl-CoA synthetase beta subunit
MLVHTRTAEPRRDAAVVGLGGSGALQTDKQVKGILVNIFGGIMKCDTIALGILAAAREIGLTLPLVVRLAGTNVDLAKRILAEQKGNIAIISADDLDDAAQKAVAAVRARK